jgi:hypothetical protein
MPGNLPVFAPATPGEHDLYLPGVGFRSPRGMASRGGPVSAIAGGRTLTVHRVALLGRGTWLDVEVSGVVPGPGTSCGILLDVSLRADGQVHQAGVGPVRNRWEALNLAEPALLMGPAAPSDEVGLELVETAEHGRADV